MKKRMLCMAFAALVLGTAAGAQEAGYYPGMGPGGMGGYGPGMTQGYGPGMMHGYGPAYGAHPGMPGGYGPEAMDDSGPAGDAMPPVWMLDLSEEQRRQIGELMGRQRAEQFERMAKMRELAGKLRGLYGNETLDPDAIGNAYDQLFALRREGIVASIRARNKVHGLLTDEQRSQLRAMGGPMGRGPGRGMMGRGMPPMTGQPTPPGEPAK